MSRLGAAEKIRVRNLTVRAGGKTLLNDVSLDVSQNEILAIIGPAGGGKTTLLRCLNRLTDLEDNLEVRGEILLDDRDLLDPKTDVASLRRRISMMFAVPTPLPMSIEDNLRLGLRFQGAQTPRGRVEESLRAAFLWDEVKDRLGASALELSGGQQQRLCLARSLMLAPDILLLDEPCSGLDPISTAKIEEALKGLKEKMSIVLVTNNVKQASRTSDRTAFLLMGQLIEEGETGQIFTSPKEQRTADYVSGRFG
ncbi:MAG: phosphate ABC transporter ATP-binding protein [Elusimicrobia bacterium]|jgi:phosphate transport system ATP-binding protein|nr:phosphate ABC transporter ATP-binding protein [Elusimicrobiota bacterium]MBK7207729.1 phosphate ABC transporter ATP-binding protein [Elusimicrobiota bacterium]MBK7544490.1 phosphate ABC transporter ATP-binding protein [Elusimicrobiota bacterium]MBK7574013.1 phosphate ABC transporter ATP-binding protein [Elusimicrobiota bacterium]MBK7689038.1 phosphate ABC transporter ATP-binding protein [Elusimicrobiota bacterium]